MNLIKHTTCCRPLLYTGRFIRNKWQNLPVPTYRIASHSFATSSSSSKSSSASTSSSSASSLFGDPSSSTSEPPESAEPAPSLNLPTETAPSLGSFRTPSFAKSAEETKEAVHPFAAIAYAKSPYSIDNVKLQRVFVTGYGANHFDIIAPSALPLDIDLTEEYNPTHSFAKPEANDGEKPAVPVISVYGSIFLTPSYAAGWNVSKWEDITLASVAVLKLLNPRPIVVLFGCGSRTQPLPNEIQQWMERENFGYNVTTTNDAISTFNILNDERRNCVVLALPYGVEPERQDTESQPIRPSQRVRQKIDADLTRNQGKR